MESVPLIATFFILGWSFPLFLQHVESSSELISLVAVYSVMTVILIYFMLIRGKDDIDEKEEY